MLSEELINDLKNSLERTLRIADSDRDKFPNLTYTLLGGEYEVIVKRSTKNEQS